MTQISLSTYTFGAYDHIFQTEPLDPEDPDDDGHFLAFCSDFYGLQIIYFVSMY